MLERKNQASLTATEKAAFVNALLALKNKVPSQLHPGDPNRHRYDDYVEVHMNAMMSGPPGWAHQGPAFLPWHRELLYRLELDLQKAIDDPAVTIPYWDWTVANSLDSSIWNADFMGGNGRASDGRVMDGPFAFDGGKWTLRFGEDGAPDLRRRFGTFPGVASLPTAAQVTDALTVIPYDVPNWDLSIASVGSSLFMLAIVAHNAPNWDSFDQPSFRNRLEGWYGAGSIHNRVHLWVAGSPKGDGSDPGTMAFSTSPDDPVFWLHHCNLDRLWTVWQQRHPNQGYHPTGVSPEIGPTGHNLHDEMIFHDMGQPAPWGDSATVDSVLNHHALGYRYDTDPPEVAPAAAERALRRRGFPWFSVTE